MRISWILMFFLTNYYFKMCLDLRNLYIVFCVVVLLKEEVPKKRERKEAMGGDKLGIYD